MYKVLEQGYDEIRYSGPFVCNETWLYLKKWPSGSRPIHSLQVEKTAVDNILLLRSPILTPLTVGSMPGNRSRWR